MTRDELRTASETLREAAELVEGEARDRLYEQSDQLAKLATREQGPDHGRLDRHMNVLYQLANELEGDAGDLVRTARDHVREYRSGVEGV